MYPAQVAFAVNGKVSLWCDNQGEAEDGRMKFCVINGGWTGYYDAELEEIQVRETGMKYHAKLVWSGCAEHSDTDYNEAIRWIQEKVDNQSAPMDPEAEGYQAPDYAEVEMVL